MQTYNMFSIKLLFLIYASYGGSLACHTKGTKNPLKQKVKLCHFVNVSKPLENNHWNINSKSSTAQKLFFFNASKPNVAILPCFENNMKYLSPSLTEQYTNENSYFTNSPTECQSICQVTDKCNHFTYNFEKNKCWMFAWKPSITSSEDGYISGPKYCETLHPMSKGGFRIEGDKPWLRFNSSFLVKVSQSAKLPQLPSHAWENCKYICSTNKNCTSFDYCFAKDTNDFELFNCYMKGITLSETLLKTPSHCVKSVKQNCSIVDNQK